MSFHPCFTLVILLVILQHKAHNLRSADTHHPLSPTRYALSRATFHSYELLGCVTSKRHHAVHWQNSPGKYTLRKSCVLAYMTAILLLHDTELNPGPRPRRTPQYPCGSCGKEVTWKHKGLCCDRCDTWFHANCQSVSDRNYVYLGKAEVSWSCLTCGLPNFSTSFFESSMSFTSTNSFQNLDSPEAPNNSRGQQNSPGPPLASSSPRTGDTQDHGKRTSKSHIRLLNLNSQSLVNKKGEFQNLIDSTDPDVIVVTET